MNRGVIAVLTVTLFTIAGWSVGAHHVRPLTHVTFTPVVTSNGPTSLSTPASSSAPPAPVGGSTWSRLPTSLFDELDEQERGDLYGNEVSDAVAKYKSDSTGSLYEEHSPHTEVPRPKSPTT